MTVRLVDAAGKVRHTVSFVIPIYNKAAYLHRFIDSLKNINFDSDFIFVDDGSVDESAKIVADACRHASYSFKLIQKENEGVSAARNLGLACATGEYVAFLDPDDEVSEEFANFALDESADLIIFAYTIVDRKGREYVASSCEHACLRGVDELRSIACKTGQLNSCWAKLYKREIIQRYALEFPSGVKVGEDIAFNLAFINHVTNCAYHDVSMIDYFVNEDSASAKVDASLLDDAMFQVKERICYARHWHLAETDMAELCVFNDRLIRSVFLAYARNHSVHFLLAELGRAADFKESAAFDGMGYWELLLTAVILKVRGFLVAVYRKVNPVYGKHS